MTDLAIELLKKHEGLRLKPYHCSAGKLTIGYGRNLDDIGITETEAEILLKHDYAMAQEEAEQLYWFQRLSEVRQAVVVNMIFNLGVSRFKRFYRMIQALQYEEYDQAAMEMLDSKWANQVGRRAEQLSAMMRFNTWQV